MGNVDAAFATLLWPLWSFINTMYCTMYSHAKSGTDDWGMLPCKQRKADVIA